MARDRHRLLMLLRGKHQDAVRHAELLKKSNTEVLARYSRLPKITLNPDLPVSQSGDELVEAIQKNQVIIVAGETGSGKTTQLPKLALLAGRGLTGLIGHTQPRRLAARSVSQRIAEELGEPLGKSVGFKVRFNETGDNDAFIRLMTDGILLAELAHDRFLTKYDTLIIDEAHERSLNIDFILGYVRKILPKRPDLKVIITSATLDVNRFSRYFNDAPIFSVEGRSFPVELRYRPISELAVGGSDDDAFDDFEENLPRAVVAAVEECYQDATTKGNPQQADILIFASTESEIRELQEALTRYGPKHTEILPLFARLALNEQQRIFNPSGKGRRIIIATNVAETALTVPNIRYVIDSGFARISRYSYRSRVQRLPIEAISQAAANQRKGRCGRIAAGVCIRLYSEADFLGRPEFTEPEIRRTNLASVILQMANLGLGTFDEFEFIEPPDYRLVNDGTKLLVELGALNEGETTLTTIGQQMAKMPIDPRLSRMILAGSHFGVLHDTLIVVSALSVQDPRERPADKQTQADQKHALFKEKDSDFLFYTKLWKVLAEQKGELTENQRRNFAKQHYLSWLRIREWKQTHKQLLELAEQLKLSFNETVTTNKLIDQKIKAKVIEAPDEDGYVRPANYENLHRALLTGLLSFVAQKTDQKNEYMAVRQQKTRIFPASTLNRANAAWVMSFEIVETSQVFMRTLAKIEPEWIISAARGLLKYHYFEPHWAKKPGLVNAYAQISLFGLIIQARQLINYEKINQTESHEIFLRDGLVTGELGITPPFLKHNLKMLEDVQRVEDKLRRRDLLVDEEALFEFYQAKVPETIASRRAFEDWRGEVEKTNPKFLCLTEADILAGSVPDTNDFPEKWQVGKLTLPTRYIFDPAGDDDGAIVTIPVQALPQLNANALSWGIQGWRLELVEALLKSLPKEQRRKLVPIPDTADEIYDRLDMDSGQSITAEIVRVLNMQDIKQSSFEVSNIPLYLRPLIEVINERKHVVAKGRDLPELQAKCKLLTISPLHQNSDQTEKNGLITTFPERFHFESNRTISGLQVSQFQALVVDEKTDQIKIQIFTDEKAAREAHRRGVLHLLSLQVVEQAKQLKKQLPKALILTFAPLGNQTQLENMLIRATLDVTFAELPLTSEEFSVMITKNKAKFLSVGQQVLKELTEIFVEWQAIRRKMMTLDQTIFGINMDDIEDQLDALHLNDFVYRIDNEHWRQYPRYLKALAMRIERLSNSLSKDTDAVKTLRPLMARIQGRDSETKLSEYRWLLEELRISLFAQPMKTRTPVSPTRLDKLWQAVETS
ncbi:ATP-dependent RNA helicase HrpA [Aquirhabdus parva]|uniref:ATP-dependent RNA helicase HrpA n=1 Tax=Aquirhabdus parva TaxID=2283318 RepID=A0A345PBF6_9GAMM|nr:ATP-dependent RNA helicase HrpA [Aquirhabdus parva]